MGNRGLIPFGFAGGLHDEDTKLIRFSARDYAPETDRWTSKDPIRFKGDLKNLYGYSFNEPINFADFSGQFVTFGGHWAWMRFGGRTPHPKFTPPRNLPMNKNPGRAPTPPNGRRTQEIPKPNREKAERGKAAGKAAKEITETVGQVSKDMGHKPDFGWWDLFESLIKGSSGLSVPPGVPYPGNLPDSCSPNNKPNGEPSFDPYDPFDPRSPYYDPYAT